MKDRILEVIKYATNGNKAKFAELLGWKPQYLQIVVNKSVGIEPIYTILKAYPEINARWLILGTGGMFDVTVSQDEATILINAITQLGINITSILRKNVQNTCNE